MAKILLIISALVIAATAYLGFATKGKVEALQTDLTAKKASLSSAQLEVKNKTAALKKADEELVAAKATIEEKERDIAAKKGEVDKLTSDLSKATTDLDEKTKKLEEIQAQLTTKTPNGNIDEMIKQVGELTKAKADLEGKVAELTQVQETLNKQLGEVRSKAAAAENQVIGYKTEYTKPGLTGTVLAYNPGWNFVVINVGDRQSLKAGKEMVVKRDGQMIAKVRVKTVEPASSIADVIPSSVAKGQSVQPGDSVIYEGRTK